jgi:hypothetical protein
MFGYGKSPGFRTLCALLLPVPSVDEIVFGIHKPPTVMTWDLVSITQVWFDLFQNH